MSPMKISRSSGVAKTSPHTANVAVCLTFFFGLIGTIVASAPAQSIPERDTRIDEIRHLDLTYSMPSFTNRAQWETRAVALRRQILVSAGLWPMPARTAMRAEVFGRIDRGEYTIEKVFFESHPGHFVTGNLYRPKNPSGRVPAILNPHGHWGYGRMENTPTASVPLRAANFARMGMVAFTYDMVGYGDSQAISHRFAPGHREGFDRAALWSVNLLGLQLWNSIRALDFLLTLPEVDPDRIGCTGASGGGTQTFLLAAVDDRVKASAPVNMISSIMQGGSLCENAPLLRIDTNNIELGALTAPRPMIMVSATGDWTRNTPAVEFPAVLGIYKLFGAENRIQTIQIDAPHNYNQASRESVYGFLARHLLGKTDSTAIAERERSAAQPAEQMVFFNRTRPAGELDERALLDSLIAEAQRQLAQEIPHNDESLARFRESFGAALAVSLMVEAPAAADVVAQRADERNDTDGAVSRRETLILTRKGRGDRVEATYWSSPGNHPIRGVALVATTEALNQAYFDRIRSMRAALLRAGHSVLVIRLFDGAQRPANNFRFFTTYNRSDDANRVQDYLTAIAYLRGRAGNAPIKIVAGGRAGLLALLARAFTPHIARMAVDVSRFDTANDDAFLEMLPIPGIRRAGDFDTAIMIARQTPLLIHNTGGRFNVDRAIESMKSSRMVRIERDAVASQELNNWVIKEKD
jgi:dienelactone hydrolase